MSAADGLAELNRSLAGQAIGPADAGYDAARVCYNAAVERRPAVIVLCRGAGDVATAFDFARARGAWKWQCEAAGTTRRGIAWSTTAS